MTLAVYLVNAYVAIGLGFGIGLWASDPRQHKGEPVLEQASVVLFCIAFWLFICIVWAVREWRK